MRKFNFLRAGRCCSLRELMSKTLVGISFLLLSVLMPMTAFSQEDTRVPKLDIYCAEDEAMPGCTSQDEVDAAFAEWLTGFYYTGGCSGVVESGLDDLLPPPFCGGSVTVIYNVYDICNQNETCTGTFTVDYEPLEAICPEPVTIPSCSTQDEVDAAFEQWLAGFTYDGGCDGVIEVGNVGVISPSYCGGSVTIDYSVYDDCSQDGCSSTFSVDAPDPIEVTCAEDMTIPGCTSQDEVNAEFEAWLDGFSYTGGCNAVEDGLDVDPPSYCGGSVTVTYTVTGDCEEEDKTATCVATFTVTGAPALEAICPGDLTIPSCSSQDDIDAVFAQWLAGFTYEGGCDDAIEVGNVGVISPSYCGGSVTVDYLVYDNCSEDACSSTFYVESPDPIEVTCAEDMTIPGCTSQDEVNAEFEAWLDGFSYTGGCNAVEDGLDVDPPSYCGGSVTITYTVTGDCEEEDKTADCVATFTVTGAPALEAICPGDLTIPSCSSQDDIDAVFAQWLAGFTYEGGCDDAIEVGNVGVISPSYCGGSVTVDYLVYDNCSEDACSSTFYVESPDPIEVTCADDMTIPGCASQDEVDAAFEAWLEGFSYTGGCNVVEEGLDVSAPDYCGGSVTVEYTVSGDCEGPDKTATCVATFTVTGAPAIEAICPGDLTIPSCSNQDDIDAVFAQWLAGFTYEGGCDDAIEVGNVGVISPSYCGGSVTVDYLVYDNCSEDACSSTFYVESPDPIEVTCADDMTIPGCASQDEVDAAFEAWLEGFSYTGGCNAVEHGLDVSAPDYCGGSVTVEYYVTGDCEEVDKTADCVATFTVTGAPAIDAMCPGDLTIPSCSSQDDIDAVFAQWLAGFTYYGGCDDVIEVGNVGVISPSYCGGSVTVDYLVYDNCSEDACSSTFYVESPDPIEITCADDLTIPGCASQDEVDEAFAEWLEGFSYTGGCNAVEHGLDVDAPDYCGGSVTVEYYVTGDCEQDGLPAKTADCIATFTVTGAPALEAICPGNMSMEACSTQDEVDAAFAIWLLSFTYEGGCDDAIEVGNVGVISPSYCGGSVTVDYLVYDNCSEDGCSSTFSVDAPDPIEVFCADDITIPGCVSQDEVNAAFEAWLEGFSYTGGCNAVEYGLDVDPPDYCGGSVTVTYAVSGDCEEEVKGNAPAYCVATFTVTGGPEIEAICPEPLILPSCSSQDLVDAEFAEWLNEFTYNGGCDDAVEEGNTGSAPDYCGGEVTIYYYVSDNCSYDECSSTFTVDAPDPIEVTCAEDMTIPGCTSQDEVNAEFETWLEGFSYTGGCNAVEDGLDVDPPSYCGGSVTVTYTVTGDCEEEDKTADCSATFTVTGGPDVVAVCPAPVNFPSCSSQDEVDAAFAIWLLSFTYEGGCDDVIEVGNVGVLSPSYCGGSVTVDYYVYDNCSEDGCSSTFSVDAPDPIEITCADDMTIPGCASQDEVDEAFAEWLDDFGYTGGCNAVEHGLDVDAPDYCGGSVSVEYYVTGDCEQDGLPAKTADCSATFTVNGGTALGAICPAPVIIPSCTSQDEVDAAFAIWLLSFTYEGGCDDVIEVGNVGVLSPSYCGGSVTVDYYVYDNCSEDGCSSTFSVDAPDPIEVTCAENMTIPGCTSQDEVNAEFEAWLEGFSYNGGCNAVEDGLDVDPPSYCGGSVTVTYTVTGDCEEEDKTADCSATFTVTGGPDVVAVCPANVVMDACSTQDEVDAAFEIWLLSFIYEGGCDDVIEVGNVGIITPSYCGGSVTVDYLVYDNCSEDACSSTFSVDFAPDLEAICPADMTMDACPTQDDVDAAFADWLDDFGYDGGCGAYGSGNEGDAPPYCGGSVTIDYYVYDDCGQSASCSATFSVDDAEELIIICPDDLAMEGCPSDDEAEAAFDEWLEGFTYTGGCNVTENFVQSIAGKTIWNEIVVDYTVTGECGQSATCTATFGWGCVIAAPGDPLAVNLEAYPNPSIQGNITISFEVPVTTHARLEVYNITGEMIDVLYDGIAEENTVIQSTLDATDLPPGMYYYRLNVKSDLVVPVTISKLIVTK